MTTGLRTILNTVKSRRTGTLPCVRAIWGAWELPPALPEVEAEQPVLGLPEVVVDLAQPPVRSQLAVLARLPVLAQVAVLVPLVVAAERPVEEVPPHQSYSAAMVGILPSAGIPRCSLVPRSGRRAKHRP